MLKTAPLKKLLNNYVYSLSFHSFKKKNKHDNDYPLQVFKKKKNWALEITKPVGIQMPVLRSGLCCLFISIFFFFLASNLTRLLEEQVIDSFTKFLKNYKNSSLHKKD
jgi:hypothetical protein